MKALIPMVRDANKKGFLFSSYTRLERMAVLSRSAWFEARAGLITKGIVLVCAPNNHQLLETRTETPILPKSSFS